MKTATTPNNAMPITLHVENATNIPAPPPELFEQWAKAAVSSHQPDAEICIRIVSKEESAQLNQQYRGKAGATNVLSFQAELPENIPSSLLGDLAICAEVILDEALEQNKTATAHWAHMVIHGCLHLLGFNHIKTTEALAMEQMEIQLLADLGMPNPYNEQPQTTSVQGQQQ